MEVHLCDKCKKRIEEQENDGVKAEFSGWFNGDYDFCSVNCAVEFLKQTDEYSYEAAERS